MIIKSKVSFFLLLLLYNNGKIGTNKNRYTTLRFYFSRCKIDIKNLLRLNIRSLFYLLIKLQQAKHSISSKQKSINAHDTYSISIHYHQKSNGFFIVGYYIFIRYYKLLLYNKMQVCNNNNIINTYDTIIIKCKTML